MPSPNAAHPDESRLLRWAWIVFAIQAAFSLWALIHGWSASLIDQHEYRQAQTALSAFWMVREGFHLAYPLPLFGPPWSAPMEFPLYQGLVAGWVKLFGGSLESAGRSISVLMLTLTLPAVWRLGRSLGWSRPTRVLALAMALTAPVYLFYGRAILIETTAVCAAAWFLACFAEALAKPTVIRIAIATLAGIVAGLAKTTTFLIFLLPAFFLLVRAWRTRQSALRLLLAAGLPVAVALATAASWVSWSDGIKQGNPLAQFLASSALQEWNWGTLGQRLSGTFWQTILDRTGNCVLALPALAVVGVLAGLAAPALRRQAFVFAGAYLVGILLFPNLFFIHDYYFSATALLLLIAAALVLGAAWESPALPRVAKITATLILFGTQWVAYDRSYGGFFKRANTPPPAVAEVIRASTEPEDVVLIYGADWGALIPYYAERRAIMVRTGHEENLAALNQVLAQLPPRRVAAMLVRSSALGKKEFIRDRLAQLGLATTPLAENYDEALYIREDLIASAARHLGDKPLPGLTLNLRTTRVEAALGLQSIDPKTLTMFSPHPTEIRGMFPLNVMQHDGQDILFAHAPNELRFKPPGASTKMILETGLMPSAYAPGPNATDGVDIIVYENLADGLRREIGRRELRPTANPSDRGAQHWEVDHGGIFAGDVTVAVTAGPKGQALQDWAYFARIEFR